MAWLGAKRKGETDNFDDFLNKVESIKEFSSDTKSQVIDLIATISVQTGLSPNELMNSDLELITAIADVLKVKYGNH